MLRRRPRLFSRVEATSLRLSAGDVGDLAPMPALDASDAPAQSSGAKSLGAKSSGAKSLRAKSLGARVRAAVGWNALSVVGTQALSLVKLVVIARLLSPDVYGLFVMAMSVSTLLGALSNLGLDASLIAERDEPNAQTRRLNTVWTMELARRALLSVALLLLVPPTVWFYGDARLYQVLPAICLLPLLQGLNNIGLVMLKRDINWARVVAYEQLNVLATTLLSIGLAWWLRSVWALVIAQLIGTLVGVALSYAFHPFRPRLMWDRVIVKRALTFGKGMFVIGAMTYVTLTADNILVGKIAGAGAMGLYVTAFALANVPVSLASGIANPILFPAYAELQARDFARVGEIFARAFALMSALLCVLALPAMMLSRDIAAILFGAKWQGLGDVLRVLMLVAIFRGWSQPVGPLVLGLNRPELEARAKTLEAALFLVLLPPLIWKFGAVGAAWASALTYALAFRTRVRMARRLVPDAMAKLPRVLALNGASVACGALVSAPFLLLPTSWSRVLTVAPLSMAVCALTLVMLQPELKRAAMGMVRRA